MHLVMKFVDKTSVYAAKSVNQVKGLISNVTFILNVRGCNNLTCTQKINKLYGRYYCASYCCTLYGQPGTRLFVTE